jgi:glycosyltransferase involved in cell wall biosynthesis
VKKKIIFFVTEDWYFCSHRLVLAVSALNAGYDVGVVTRVQSHGDTIRQAGINLIPIQINRSGLNFFEDIRSFIQLVKIYRKEKPDIVHHVALKPVLYGSLAAIVAKIPFVVNALAGMGSLFSSSSRIIYFLKKILLSLFRVLCSRTNTKLILQNKDDFSLFDTLGVPRANIVLIPGSGVDTSVFSVSPEPQGTITITLVSRMLKDKGIYEFVSAAQKIKKQGISAKFILVGGADPLNPSSIDEKQLLAWDRQGDITWLGRQNDIAHILHKTHIAVLPSYYREGLPKALLEAASCGKPIVTTDAPGCREIVQDGVNGILVPVRDSEKLAQAIVTLIQDPAKRKTMGQKGRELVEKYFAQEIICKQTLDVYHNLLAGNAGCSGNPFPENALKRKESA